MLCSVVLPCRPPPAHTTNFHSVQLCAQPIAPSRSLAPYRKAKHVVLCASQVPPCGTCGVAAAKPARQPTSRTPVTTSVTITNALSGAYPRASERAAMPACAACVKTSLASLRDPPARIGGPRRRQPACQMTCKHSRPGPLAGLFLAAAPSAHPPIQALAGKLEKDTPHE